jgi:hypothetical protein
VDDLAPRARYRADGARVGEPEEVDAPVALRLDFDTGPVWMVAAVPDGPPLVRPFVGGDEIMIFFEAERLRGIGFAAPFV